MIELTPENIRKKLTSFELETHGKDRYRIAQMRSSYFVVKLSPAHTGNDLAEATLFKDDQPDSRVLVRVAGCMEVATNDGLYHVVSDDDIVAILEPVEGDE